MAFVVALGAMMTLMMMTLGTMMTLMVMTLGTMVTLVVYAVPRIIRNHSMLWIIHNYPRSGLRVVDCRMSPVASVLFTVIK